MKGWHWGLIVGLIVAYFIGVKFPGPGTSLLTKVGV